MNFENIILEKKTGFAWLTINRPKVLNALNRATMKELGEALTLIQKDPEIKVVLLTGAEKSFVAGADINELQPLTALLAMDYAQEGQEILRKITRLRVPVIAVINGFALGGGCELACACDFRIASTKAKFGQPEVNLGLIPGYGGTQRLTRLIGKGLAFELCVSGELINADEAYRIGLVNRLFEPESLKEGAEKLASTIASRGPLAVSLVKQSMGAHLDLPIDDALDFEARLFGLVFDSLDQKEGTRAFLEKRPPLFQGK